MTARLEPCRARQGEAGLERVWDARHGDSYVGAWTGRWLRLRMGGVGCVRHGICFECLVLRLRAINPRLFGQMVFEGAGVSAPC